MLSRNQARLAAALAVCAMAGTVAAQSPSPAYGFGNDVVGQDVHRAITSQALIFLTQGSREAINEGHDWADDSLKRMSADQYHFDDCEFDEGTDNIEHQYDDARESLSRHDAFWFFKNFGIGLHGAQDFYSHSNWVELGFPAGDAPVQSDLVDISGAQDGIEKPWSITGDNQHLRDDIYLANDDWSGIPTDAALTRGGTADHVQTVTYSDGSEHRLLATGTGKSSWPFNDHGCAIPGGDPFRSYPGLSHDDVLNKDSENNPGDDGDGSLHLYQDARALAKLQTQYEWCRLVAQTGGYAATGLLLTLAVREGESPHPANTPCSEHSPRSDGVTVTVTVTSIDVTDVREDGEDVGEVQVAAALFDQPSKFRTSVHHLTSGGSIALHNGDSVPMGMLPEPMTICVPPNTGTFIAVNGWDNDGDGGSGRSFAFDTGERADGSSDGEDDILYGGTGFISPSTAAGTVRRIIGEHLTVKYRIDRAVTTTCGTDVLG